MADLPLFAHAGAYVSLVWGCIVFLVQCIGNSRIFGSYSSRPHRPVVSSLPKQDAPHITIIRPVKGVEPGLYQCLASTFQLDYPQEKLTVRLCVADKRDAAYPILVKLVEDFPGFDARVLVEEEDPLLYGSQGHIENLGPNPKIRNISRAYREAKGDTMWIVDCNVWVGRGVAGRMVDKLHGLLPDGKRTTPYKFVHLLPLVTDTTWLAGASSESEALLSSACDTSSAAAPDVTERNVSTLSCIKSLGGGRLDEMFMATTHAKFYSAINTVGVAPCVVGKSNMFRKSHIDSLTDPVQNPTLPGAVPGLVGIDYFSNYICEDHLIGDLLWKARMPEFLGHGLVYGDLAIQPIAGFSVQAYIARRCRWLRARKWTVILATLVEPGIESLLCCAHLSYAFTTVPWFNQTFGVSQTWKAMGAAWIALVTIWMIGDWFTFRKLHTGQSVEVDENTPKFARGLLRPGGSRRSFLEWLPAWIGREVLALPIWTWAVLLGSTVSWRGTTFRVRMDMSVVHIGEREEVAATAKSRSSGVQAPNDEIRSRSKPRVR